MKIGLFFGTFNPVHIGHLIIANHIEQYSDLQQIWFVLTPRSPFKKNESLADDYQRLNMLNLAIEDYPNLKTSAIELEMPQPNYTTHTLAKLRENHPTHDFTLIMGEDNLSYLHKWKNADFLVKTYDIIVYPRLHRDVKPPQVPMDRITKVESPVIEISATFIRNSIAQNKNVKPLLPPDVFEYIDGSNLYKK